MSKKKELEQALQLTDEMILIQGIVLIEQGMCLMRWNNPQELKTKLEALDGLIYDLKKQCTQTRTAEALYVALSTVELE